MAHMQTQLNNTNKNGGNYNNTSGGNKSNSVSFWRQFYCWTYGACNQQGSCCLSKAEGHKENSTINKKINRSDQNFHHCDKNNNSWRCGTYNEVIKKDKNKSPSLPIIFSYVAQPIIKTIPANEDSGALRNYFKNEYKNVLIDIKPLMNQVVNIPNNKVLPSSFKVQTPVYSVLSKKTRD